MKNIKRVFIGALANKTSDAVFLDKGAGIMCHGDRAYDAAGITKTRQFMENRHDSMYLLDDASAPFYDIACAAVRLVENALLDIPGRV